MIKSLTIINHLGESIVLELGRPEKSGFLVQSITGLGPPKATINATEIATMDGALFNSSRVNSRNIVLTLKFLDKPTIEDIRQLSYKYFPIKKPITFIVETDNRLCAAYGRIEANEPNIFSKSETTQISIVCPDPYFYSLTKTFTVFSGVEDLFGFPFSNNSLTQNLISFGNIKSDTAQNIYYTGDAEIGMIINIHALGTATNITIYNTETRESMKIDTTKLLALTGSGIVAGDDIIISTVKGDKHITLLRGGTYTNILNCLDKDADWFQLSKGDNIFAYTAETGVNNLEFRVENQTVYEGV